MEPQKSRKYRSSSRAGRPAGGETAGSAPRATTRSQREPASSRASAYPPRRAKTSGKPRHARPSPDALTELWQHAAAWFARIRATAAAGPRRAAVSRPSGPRSRRVVWPRRIRPFLASARPYSGQLSAVAGIVIVLLSVYLIRQGIMMPSSVPFGGGADPAASEGQGVPASTDPGTGGSGQDAAGQQGSGQEAADQDAAGQTSAGSTGDEQAQPVLEDEGTGTPTAADVGPLSVGDVLALFGAPAGGEVVRAYGYYESALFEDWRYHTGVDIALQAGTSVRAAGPGTVLTVEGTELEGWRIVIGHGAGVTTVYSQLGSASVAEGDQVATGETIAVAGASGALESDLGVHLHFEIRVDGQATDPTRYLGG